MRAFSRFFWLVALGVVCLGLVGLARAQAGGSIHIFNLPEEDAPTIEQDASKGDALVLRRTFILQDADGRVRREDIAAERVKVELGDDTYTPGLTRLQDDLAVVLLVDNSSVMTSNRVSQGFKDAKNALATSIGQLRDGARIILMSFNKTPKAVTTLNTTRDDTIKQLKSLQADGDRKEVCLNQAIDEAVGQLKELPGSRAIIVLTSSKDTCTNLLAADVIQRASDAQVQIYLAGLEGPTPLEDLVQYAQGTNGLSEVRSADKLSVSFDNFVGALNNQWQMRVLLYPDSGPQAITIKTTLDDGTTFTSDPVNFTSPKEFVRPPHIDFLNAAKVTADVLQVKLVITSPERIDHFIVSVVENADEKLKITHEVANTVELEGIQQLEEGHTYELVIAAVDAKDQKVLDEQGQKQEIRQEFEFRPSAIDLEVSLVETPTPNNPRVVIQTDVASKRVVAYRLSLVMAGAENPVVIPFKSVFAISEKNIEVSLKDDLDLKGATLPDGTYAIAVEALDADDNTLIVQQTKPFVYKQASWMDNLLSWMQANPWSIGLLILVGLAGGVGLIAIIWMAMPKKVEAPKEIALELPKVERRVAMNMDDYEAPTPPAAAAPKAPPAAPPAPPKPQPQPQPRPAAPPPAAQTPPPAPAQQRPPSQPAPAAPQRPPTQPQPVAQAPAPQTPPVSQPRPPSQASRGLPPARLLPYAPANLGVNIVISKSPFTIGRREGNDAVLPVDRASGVSSHHVTITCDKGIFYLVDENSANGTSINGQMIPKQQLCRLDEGAVIGLGPNIKLQFRLQ